MASFRSNFCRHNSRSSRPQHKSTSVENKGLGGSSLPRPRRNEQRKDWEEGLTSQPGQSGCAKAPRLCSTAAKFLHCECTLLSYTLLCREKPFVNEIGVLKRVLSLQVLLPQWIRQHYKRNEILHQGLSLQVVLPFRPQPRAIKSEFVKRMYLYANVANLFGKSYAGFWPKTKGTISGPELSGDGLVLRQWGRNRVTRG